MKKDNRLSWGVSLIFFGLLFLLHQFNILPSSLSVELFNEKNYPIYVGVIFLIFNRNRSIGLTLILIGTILRVPDFVRFTIPAANYIWPIVALCAGIVLVFFIKSNRN